MTPPSDAVLARRARNWFFVAACCSSIVMVIAPFGHTGRFGLTIYGIGAVVLWVNVWLQHRALRRALNAG